MNLFIPPQAFRQLKVSPNCTQAFCKNDVLARDPMLDAYLRHRMFPNQKSRLTPFDDWLQSQLRLKKIVNTPRKEPLGAENYKDYRSIRKGDKVRQNSFEIIVF